MIKYAIENMKPVVKFTTRRLIWATAKLLKQKLMA
jgi:hypothetical protein